MDLSSNEMMLLVFERMVLRIIFGAICVNGKWRIRPRIFSKDGNLHISPAADKNVVIRCDGKSNFFVNNVNVLDSLRNVTKKYDDRYESQLELTKDIENIRNVLHTLNNQMNIISNRTQTSNFQDIPRIQRRLRNAQSSIRALKANIDLDECSSDPCKNGGTCVDLYKRFHCLCPEGWAGASCEMDIDECYGLAG
uniref:EGF-like domain-containing protein n=1 Tax=Megaselia scalaris TaxID=36166 RepID=T1H1G3_MEGSC